MLMSTNQIKNSRRMTFRSSGKHSPLQIILSRMKDQNYGKFQYQNIGVNVNEIIVTTYLSKHPDTSCGICNRISTS